MGLLGLPNILHFLWNVSWGRIFSWPAHSQPSRTVGCQVQRQYPDAQSHPGADPSQPLSPEWNLRGENYRRRISLQKFRPMATRDPWDWERSEARFASLAWFFQFCMGMDCPWIMIVDIWLQRSKHYGIAADGLLSSILLVLVLIDSMLWDSRPQDSRTWTSAKGDQWRCRGQNRLVMANESSQAKWIKKRATPREILFGHSNFMRPHGWLARIAALEPQRIHRLQPTIPNQMDGGQWKIRGELSRNRDDDQKVMPSGTQENIRICSNKE